MALHSYLSFHCCKFDALSSAEEEKALKHTRWMSGNFFVAPDRSSATPPSPGNERWMEGCWRGRPVCDFSRDPAAASAADAAAQARGERQTHAIQWRIKGTSSNYRKRKQSVHCCKTHFVIVTIRDIFATGRVIKMYTKGYIFLTTRILVNFKCEFLLSLNLTKHSCANF